MSCGQVPRVERTDNGAPKSATDDPHNALCAGLNDRNLQSGFD